MHSTILTVKIVRDSWMKMAMVSATTRVPTARVISVDMGSDG